ncbi:MAG: hypothetical protein ACRDLK_10850 [Gaiellaceae bacterium]
MKLCMFSPRELDLERGWPGRVEGDTVVQLAAQTLQSFFTGGGRAREHAVFPLADVVLRAPVLHPPSVRIFDSADDFRFANPAAVVGPDEVVFLPESAEELVPVFRWVAIVGAEGSIGAYTQLLEWTAPALAGEKRHDFALSLGPTAMTPDPMHVERPDWEPLLAQAALNTRLLPGDLVASPGSSREPVRAGASGEVSLPPFGVLRNPVAAR